MKETKRINVLLPKKLLEEAYGTGALEYISFTQYLKNLIYEDVQRRSLKDGSPRGFSK